MSENVEIRELRSLSEILKTVREEYEREPEFLAIHATKGEFEFIEFCVREIILELPLEDFDRIDILLTEISDILNDWDNIMEFKNQNRRE